MAPSHVDLSEKRCTKCGETKPIAEFSRDRKQRDGYRHNCRDCLKKYWAEWRANNPDYIAYAAKYRAKNPQKINAKSREYRAKNRDKTNAASRKWRIDNPERHKELNAKWYKEHPEYTREKNRRRKAAHRGIAGIQTEKIDADKVFQRDGWRCGLCSKKVNKLLKHPDPLSASLDHIVPLAAGGEHTYINVQLAHLRCNIKKKHTGGGDQLAIFGGVE